MPNPAYDPSLYANVPVEIDSSGYNNVRLDSPNPPPVNYETKPHFIPHDPPVELDGVVVQPSTSSTSSSTTPTDSPSTPRDIWGGELGVLTVFKMAQFFMFLQVSAVLYVIDHAQPIILV